LAIISQALSHHSVDECIDLIATGKHHFLGRAKLTAKMLPEDLAPWVDKLAVLSLKDGESTTAHVLDLRGVDLIVDVLSSNRPYPDSEHRAFAIPFRRILSVCPAPSGLSPRRALPAPDPCYSDYCGFVRILAFVPVILLIGPGSVVLFVMLQEFPYGTQFASLIVYTAATVLGTFSAAKGQQRYLFTCPVVGSQLSRLFQRHVGFLAALFMVETAAFHLRPHLSAYWRTGKPFEVTVGILCLCLYSAQMFSNRFLLKRAHLERSPV